MSRHSANEFATVELVNKVQRRRWPLAEKLRIVEESSLPGMGEHPVAPLGEHRMDSLRRSPTLLNRRLVELGQARVNHKRVYRIMRLQGLLLTRRTGNRPERSHEGKVITLRRNLRWSADAFEVGCWNGEKVRVVFALDCCDREIMGFAASTYGISGSMVRDLMLDAWKSGSGRAERRTGWSG